MSVFPDHLLTQWSGHTQTMYYSLSWLWTQFHCITTPSHSMGNCGHATESMFKVNWNWLYASPSLLSLIPNLPHQNSLVYFLVLDVYFYTKVQHLIMAIALNTSLVNLSTRLWIGMWQCCDNLAITLWQSCWHINQWYIKCNPLYYREGVVIKCGQASGWQMVML